MAAVDQEPQGDEDGEPAQPVAKARIDGDVVVEGVGSDQNGAAVRGDRGHDAAVGPDGDGEAGVGGAKNPAAILDGADAHLGQVLLERRGTAEPAIVGKVDEQASAAPGELADRVGDNGLVTDENGEASARQLADGKLLAGMKLANLRDDRVGKGEPAPPGNEFAEGDELDFVVGKDAVTGRVHENGGVVGFERAAVGP